MKLIDRFVSRELVVNVLFAIAVLSSVLVIVEHFPQTGKNRYRNLRPLLQSRT